MSLPILGICFGHQILSKLNGGKVKQSKHREFGLANIYKKKESLLTKNFFGTKKTKKVWMSHADQISKLPLNFKVIASSTNSKFAIVENKNKKIFGIQFHPEVNLRMHLAWLYFAGYRLNERGAQTRKEQLTLRLKYGKNINLWLDNFLDNHLLNNIK